MEAAVQNLTATFAQRDADNSTGAQTNSYSIQVFSASDPMPLFQHYHTASNLPTFNSTGVTRVDANTVFRIGSLTKIFTIYTFLIEAGDVHFNSPITDFVPELAALARNNTGNAITRVAWEDITIGELASHMAGIAADDSLMGELTQTLGNKSVAAGFPPLSRTQIPTCGVHPLCNRTEFFATFSHLYPAFAPAETPAYSNVAFQILSYALQTITNKEFQTSLQDQVLKPLNLTHTSYSMPNESFGVIPGNLSATEWAFDLGEESPAGGMYSSVADISSLGRSILRSSFLTPAQTRRWLKPATLTSDLRETVGYPWGIRRIIMDPERPYDLITAYSKAGSIGAYSSLTSLLPEFGIGFSILIAGDLTLSNWALADALGNIILPALQQAAMEEAQTTYAGNYSSAGLNSTLTITTDSTKPGLGISTWISNGTDMMAESNLLLTGSINSSFSIRLYPTDLQVTADDGSKQVVLKAIFEDLATQAKDNRFTAGCGTWIGPTAFVYGAMALDEFIFTLNPSGMAMSVEISALRLSMEKVSIQKPESNG